MGAGLAPGSPVGPSAHSRVALAPGLDADEETQAVPGAWRPPPGLLCERCRGKKARWSRLAGAHALWGAPPTAPDLTGVQRGGERIEASDRRRVLATGQVQAGTAVEGALGVGLRDAQRSARAHPPPPARAPPCTRWPRLTR